MCGLRDPREILLHHSSFFFAELLFSLLGLLTFVHGQLICSLRSFVHILIMHYYRLSIDYFSMAQGRPLHLLVVGRRHARSERGAAQLLAAFGQQLLARPIDTDALRQTSAQLRHLRSLSCLPLRQLRRCQTVLCQ